MQSTLFILSAMATQLLASPTPPSKSNEPIYLSPGYLVPANISSDAFDESAPWMEQALPFVHDDDDEAGVSSIEARDIEMGLLEDRAGAYTEIMVSDTYNDYGCGGDVDSIRSILGDAVDQLCGGGRKVCNGGSKYTRKVQWMKNHGYKRDAWVEVRVEGSFLGDNTANRIRQGVRALVRDDTVTYERRRREGTWTGISESCEMAQFTNYIHVRKWGKLDVDVRIYIELNNVNSKRPPLNDREKDLMSMLMRFFSLRNRRLLLVRSRRHDSRRRERGCRRILRRGRDAVRQ